MSSWPATTARCARSARRIRSGAGARRDGVERRVEGGRSLLGDLPEQVFLRVDVVVERRLLDAQLGREVGQGRALVAPLGEEAGGDAR